MGNINTLNVNGVEYKLTDSQAQILLATLQSDIESLQTSIEEINRRTSWIEVD